MILLLLHTYKRRTAGQRGFSPPSTGMPTNAPSKKTRSKQITIAILVHNTSYRNRQKWKFYVDNPTCPICHHAEETLRHVLQCPDPRVTQVRNHLFREFEATLHKIHTPAAIPRDILHGFSDWLTPTPVRHPWAHTEGPLYAADVVLTSTFHDQFHTLGWYQFTLGLITPTADKVSGSKQWAFTLIDSLWHVSIELWHYRNSIVHGQTVEEQASILLGQLHDKVQSYYATFTTTSSFILTHHHYLFTARTLD